MPVISRLMVSNAETIIIFIVFLSPFFTSENLLASTVCAKQLINESSAQSSRASVPKFIELEDGQRIRVHKTLRGRPYIYLFPLIRTEVTFIDSEPYVTVYRGIRDRINPNRASGPYDPYDSTPSSRSRFGDFMYVTLDPEVAIGYFTRLISFDTPEHLTLIRLQLPLRKAFISKRQKGLLGQAQSDEYIRALPNRHFIWFKWRAWQRLRERELVWNLNELGGSISDPLYQIKVIDVPVAPNTETGEYHSINNWYQAQRQIEDLWKLESWRALD